MSEKSTASTQGAHPNMTCKEILAAMENVKPELMNLSAQRDAAEARIIQFMKDHGFNPAEGCILVLPQSLEAGAGIFPPSFVKFSSLISAPVMLRGLAPSFWAVEI